MRWRVPTLGLVLSLGGTLLVPAPADAAVVICQKKQRLKLRVDVCKAKETPVDASELGVVGPPGPAATSLWAVVEADGTLARGSGVVSSGLPDDPGGYEVIFDQDVTGCAYVASPGLSTAFDVPPDGSTGVVGRAGAANGIYVISRDGAGANTNASFHVAVFCP